MAILMAVDIFPDAAMTMLNVTADAVAATVVANHSGEMASAALIFDTKLR